MNVNNDDNEASYTYSKSDDASGTHGSYDFEVIAYDDTDSTEAGSDSINDIVMDTQSPEISSESPSGAINNDNPDIEASFEDSVSGLEEAWIYFDESGDEANESGENPEIDFSDHDFDDLDDGEYTVEYGAVDQAGNSIDGSWDFTVDTEYDGDSDPSFSVEDESDGVVNFDEDKDIEVDFGDADSETDTTVTCVVDGVEVDDFTVSDDDPDEDDTVCEIDHDDDEAYYDSVAEIHLEMEDEAGNSETSDTEEIGLDSRPPRVITWDSASGAAVFNDDFKMSYEAIDNVAGVDYVDYTVDDSNGEQLDNSSGEFTVDTEGLEENRYEVEAQAVDELGKVSSSKSFEFDFYPDESPELNIEAPAELNITEGDSETVDVTLSNSGRILIPSGEVEASALADSAEFDSILPGESQTVSLEFAPEGSDLGEHQVEFSVSTAAESVEIDVLVEANEDTRQNITGETDDFVEEYEGLSEEVEAERPGLSDERSERLDEDFSEFEASVQELESAVENEEYYHADEILDGLDSEMQSARQTFEEVEEEQSVADRNRMIVFAFVLLFAVLGGGAGFLVYSDDYDVEIPDLEQLDVEQLTGGDSDEEETGYSHSESEEESEPGLVEKIKSKIEGLTGEEEEESDEPGYEFK